MPLPVGSIGLIISGIDALAAYLEKRAKEGEAARAEVADTTDMDAAHAALQAAFAPAGVDLPPVAEVDEVAVDENAERAAMHLREALVLLRGEA